MAEANYPVANSRDSSAGMTYDRATGKWVPVSSGSTSSSKQSSSTQSSGSVSSTTSSSQASSKDTAQATVNAQKLGTLQGDMSLSPSPDLIKVTQATTVRVEGVGKFLTGLYFVKQRVITMDSSGIGLQITVLRNGFGDTLKQPSVQATATAARVEEVPKATAQIKVGDKVKIVGDSATYSNASDGVKIPSWVKQKTHTIDGISKDGKKARLKEIWSWTYISNLQKV